MSEIRRVSEGEQEFHRSTSDMSTEEKIVARQKLVDQDLKAQGEEWDAQRTIKTLEDDPRRKSGELSVEDTNKIHVRESSRTAVSRVGREERYKAMQSLETPDVVDALHDQASEEDKWRAPLSRINAEAKERSRLNDERAAEDVRRRLEELKDDGQKPVKEIPYR